MNGKVKSEKTTRVTFAVPEFDSQVSEWVKSQRNLSLSIRLLIKSHITKYGMIDVTALPVMIDESSQFAGSESVQKTQAVIEKTVAPEIKQEPAIKAEPESVSAPAATAAPVSVPVSEPVQAEPVSQPAVQPRANSMLDELMK